MQSHIIILSLVTRINVHNVHVLHVHTVMSMHVTINLLDFTEWVKIYFIKYIMYFSSARVAGLGEIFDERGSWANKLVARL